MKEKVTKNDKKPSGFKSFLERVKNRFQSNILFNIVGATVVLLIIFGVLAQITGYQRFSEAFTEEYSENALRIARSSALLIDPDALDGYLEQREENSDYLELRDALDQYCNSMDARFIYVIRPSEDYSEITFVVSAVQMESGFSHYDIGYTRDTSSEEYEYKYRKLCEGESDHEIVVRDDPMNPSGAHITAMVPVMKDGGEVVGILCVQRQMEALTTGRHQYMIYMFIVTAFLVIFVTFLYQIMLKSAIIRPLRRITSETMRFATTPSKAEQPLTDSIKMKNEIGQLAESVDKMESDTLDYIDNLTKFTAERQRIGTELGVASSIQQGMLNTLPLRRAEFDIFAVMNPAKEVGGDFYDYFLIDDDHLCMMIADVSGKGVPAALFMAISKVILTDGTMVSMSPAEILRIANERICKKNKLDMFVTVWLGILEISTGKVTAANAGHEYPAIYRGGSGFELLKDKHGFVIGGMDGLKYKEYEIQLGRGDGLFLYTDGVAEATNKDNELFGTERMINALNISHDSKPEDILAAVNSKVDEFVGEADQFDDLTMMCLKYFGSESVEDGSEEAQK